MQKHSPIFNKHDREYQIWKRKPLSIELISGDLFKQKLEYIHYNPVKAGLCENPEIITIHLRDFTTMDWTLLKCWYIIQVIDTIFAGSRWSETRRRHPRAA